MIRLPQLNDGFHRTQRDNEWLWNLLITLSLPVLLHHFMSDFFGKLLYRTPRLTKWVAHQISLHNWAMPDPGGREEGSPSAREPPLPSALTILSHDRRARYHWTIGNWHIFYFYSAINLSCDTFCHWFCINSCDSVLSSGFELKEHFQDHHEDTWRDRYEWWNCMDSTSPDLSHHQPKRRMESELCAMIYRPVIAKENRMYFWLCF